MCCYHTVARKGGTFIRFSKKKSFATLVTHISTEFTSIQREDNLRLPPRLPEYLILIAKITVWFFLLSIRNKENDLFQPLQN